MKAPICWLCGRKCFDEPAELVRFRDYAPLPAGIPGHSPGLEWFCSDHAPAARELANLASASALAVLQKRYGFPPDGGPAPRDCERCGRPIPSRRLREVPAAKRCWSCQVEAERPAVSPAAALPAGVPKRGWWHRLFG